ncbi:hypothetical protein ABZ543_08145 [Streptomyces roseifaciens]
MTDEELNELVRSLPLADPVDAHKEAAAYAAAWEPSVVPTPEFTRNGTVRFPCPRGCGWFHDENPGLDAIADPYVLVLPTDTTSADISAAISRQASERAEAQQARVEAAVIEHDRKAHGGSGPA